MSLIRAGGRVVCFGGASFNSDKGKFLGAIMAIPKVVSMVTLNSLTLLFNSQSVCGVNMKIIGDKRPDILQYELQTVIKMVHDGQLHSHVSQVVPWEDIGKVQFDMENRRTTGKIVLTVSHDENPEGEIAKEEEEQDNNVVESSQEEPVVTSDVAENE